MIKVYRRNNAVLIDYPEKEVVYVNPTDSRLIVRNGTFLLNDGQSNKTFELGTYDKLTDGNGNSFSSYVECSAYLLEIADSAADSLRGPFVAERNFYRKLVETNTDETYYKISFYDKYDTLLKTKEIREGGSPDETIDPAKTIEITNTDA